MHVLSSSVGAVLTASPAIRGPPPVQLVQEMRLGAGTMILPNAPKSMMHNDWYCQRTSEDMQHGAGTMIHSMPLCKLKPIATEPVEMCTSALARYSSLLILDHHC